MSQDWPARVRRLEEEVAGLRRAMRTHSPIEQAKGVSAQEDQHGRLALARLEAFGGFGWAEWNFGTGETVWSPGMFRLLGQDPTRAPMKFEAITKLVEDPRRARMERFQAAGESAPWQARPANGRAQLGVSRASILLQANSFRQLTSSGATDEACLLIARYEPIM